jgi:preprotein translocase subunit SecA
VRAARSDLEPEQQEVLKSHLAEIVNLPRFWTGDALPTEEEARDGELGILASLKAGAPQIYTDILRYFLLEELDRAWKEHLLAMDQLRDGIGLRGYGQRDPKQEYKREGFALFQDMLFRIRENVLKSLTRVRIQLEPAPGTAPAARPAALAAEQIPEHADTARAEVAQAQATGFKHKEPVSALSYSGGDGPARPATVKRATPKVGRNDDCPCGSGKKYKKCCGRGA